MENIGHFITTRFNLGLYDLELDHAQWMRERIARFKRYTLPAIQNQTCKNFLWLIVVDDRTPIDLARLRKNNRLDYLIVHGGSENKTYRMAEVIRKWIQIYLCYTKKFVRCLTSRIDNDDVIHRKYVENLQQNVPRDQKYATLTFPSGYVYNMETNTLWHRDYKYNQFASLVEPANGKLKTVWCECHNGLKTLKAHRGICAEPMWCWMLHGNNLSGTTKLKDRRAVQVQSDPMKILRPFGSSEW